MKAAILFFGQYREFDTSVPIWKEYFEKNLECDFYVSTWGTSRQKYDYLQPDTAENIKEIVVTEQLIKEILPNCVSSILDENTIFVDNTPQDDTDFKGRAIRQSKMFYHWKNLQRMLRDSKKYYDLVILLRPDVRGMICNDDGTFENAVDNWKFDSNILYCDSNMVIRMDEGNKLVYLVNDYLFCGSLNIMNRFFDTIPNMDQDLNKYNIWTPHIDLANFLIKENLYVSNLHPFKIQGLVRPQKPKRLGYSSFAPVF